MCAIAALGTVASFSAFAAVCAMELLSGGARAAVGVDPQLRARSIRPAAEPDGIALPPADCGGTPEQQAARIRQMNFAVDRLQSLPRTAVYVDAGHSAWHAVGTIAARLLANGIDAADGFFLNVSNYGTDQDLIRYGTMISKCIAYIDEQGGSPNDCANQYWPRGRRRVVREPRHHDRSHALRDRHQPQRAGAVDAAGQHVQRSAGLVQPARPWPRG